MLFSVDRASDQGPVGTRKGRGPHSPSSRKHVCRQAERPLVHQFRDSSSFDVLGHLTAPLRPVAYLASANTLKIINWACTSNARSRLEIRGVIPVRTSVGYAVIRGRSRITLCKNARMVLVKDHGYDFFILTAFPEPPRP